MRSEINRNDARLLLAANLAGLLIFTEAGKEARHRRIGESSFRVCRAGNHRELTLRVCTLFRP